MEGGGEKTNSLKLLFLNFMSAVLIKHTDGRKGLGERRERREGERGKGKRVIGCISENDPWRRENAFAVFCSEL